MSLQEAQLRKNELDNLLKKYDHTKFLEQLNSFVSHVKKNYFSKPFLEQVLSIVFFFKLDLNHIFKINF